MTEAEAREKVAEAQSRWYGNRTPENWRKLQEAQRQYLEATESE